MEETVEILKGLRKAYEKHHGVVITDEAVQAAVTLSERYINDRFLPDKAIDLLDEAAARKQLQGYKIPKALEELKNRAEELEELKEAAIVENDFGKAADYKKEQVEVRQKFEQQRKRLRKKAGENATKVRGEDIAEDGGSLDPDSGAASGREGIPPSPEAGAHPSSAGGGPG